MKKIILFKKINFLFIFINYKIYSERVFIEKETKNIKIISDDYQPVSLSLRCEHEASLLKKKIIGKILHSKKVKFLTDWFNSKIKAQYFFGKPFVKEASAILKSLRYAESVYKKLHLSGKVYIWPQDFSLYVYYLVKRENIIGKNIKIHPYAIIYLFLLNLIKFSYILLKSIFLPEIYLLKKNNKCVKVPSNYQLGVYMSDGYRNAKISYDQLFIDNDNFNINNVIFINNIGITNKANFFNCKKVNLLNLNNNNISKFEYLKYFYKSFFIWRLKSIFLSFFCPWMSYTLYEALKSRISWETFFSKNDISNIIYLTESPKVIDSIIFQKEGAKISILYFSTTEVDMLEKHFIDKNISYSYEFMHMISDYFISSPFSFEWAKGQENLINTYIPFGPVFSDSIRHARNNKKIIKDNIGICNKKKLITFFDNTVGIRGVLNELAYENLLNSILKLCHTNSNKYYALKTKNDLDSLINKLSPEINKLFLSLKQRKNFIYINESSIDQFEAIGISDLVVSSPLSSIIFESIAGLTKTLIYDPDNQYESHRIISNLLHNLRAHDYKSLEQQIDFWLNLDEKFFREYIDSKLGIKDTNNISFNGLRKLLLKL